ncbi:MAG: type II toxin-antitoxin system RelE family toxin, partial [Actinomycetota bacterium]
MARVELARRAQRDLQALGRPERDRVRRALKALAAGAENIDAKPLAVRPWMRLRTGNFRILYRNTMVAIWWPEWSIERIWSGRSVPSDFPAEDVPGQQDVAAHQVDRAVLEPQTVTDPIDPEVAHGVGAGADDRGRHRDHQAVDQSRR